MYKINDIKNTILCGHVLDILRNIPDESIDMGITSPPYFSLRDYKTNPQIWGGFESCNHSWIWDTKKGISGGTKSKKVRTKGTENFQIVENKKFAFCQLCGAWFGELGGEPTVSLYIKNLTCIFREFKRVLKSTGSLWVNLGDTYANRSYQVTGTKQVNGSQPKVKQPQAKDSGIIPKSLCGIPDRFKIAMIDEQWICRNEIIWQRPNQMPTSAKDRFTVDFEKFYWFTKNPKYYFEQQIEPSVNENGEKRNVRSVWSINTKPMKEAHFAVFPDTLIETPIKACSPEGGVVLDIFFGSGTTGLVSKKLNRNYIGIELNPEYIEIANRRLKNNVE